MVKWLSLYLVVTGVMSLIVLAMPALVIVGMMALILPGLILALFPTAFLWGLVFAAFWAMLRTVMGDMPASLAALVLTAAVAIVIPKTLNLPFYTAAAAERARDQASSSSVRLSGTVKLTIPYAPWQGQKDQIACDLACHAILYAPGVDAVILEETQGDKQPRTPVQLRLEKRNGGCVTQSNITDGGWGTLRDARDPLIKSWLVRQAGGECIVREPVSRQPDFDVRLETTSNGYRRADWSLKPPSPLLRRLVIERVVGGKPEMLLRRTFVWGRPLIVPLTIMPEGSLENFGFGWGRETAKDYAGPGHFVPIELLREATNAALTPDLKAMGDAVRVQLAAALADPARPEGDAAFALVPALFQDIGKNGPREGDRELLAKAVGDPRVTEVHYLWDVTRKYEGGVPELRAPIVHRLLTVPADHDKGNSILGEWLGQLPDGSFATLTAEEEALLADPERRRWAAGLIRRLADLGPAELPRLVAFLGDQKTNYPARIALCVMGPLAAPALPQVEARLNGPYYSREWQLTLARMGKPVESFRNDPNNSWSDERMQQDLRERLARFDAKRDCR